MRIRKDKSKSESKKDIVDLDLKVYNGPQIPRITILDDSKKPYPKDAEYTIYIYDENNDKLIEVDADSNPFIIDNIRFGAFKHYLIWAVDSDGNSSYPRDLWLLYHDQHIIPPPGCHIDPNMLPGIYKDYKLVLGKGDLLFLIEYSSSSMPMNNARFILTNRYIPDDVIISEPTVDGSIGMTLPYGRYDISVLCKGEKWITNRSIRIRHKHQGPLVFIWGIY